jgi:tRNA pseudouridine55 synthase
VLVDKPGAMTSHDVVQQVRRALGTRAAGHTGTLDPFATGLLIVLVGRATRLSRFVEGQSKTYLATARLGQRTDTDDLTGCTIGVATEVAIPEFQVRDALAQFQGTQLQRPPVYSAKHVGGERSHRKARRGEPVELANASITVHQLELLEFKPPEVTFRAVVSAGTYIRALARDLGERLGVGAHLTTLRREAIGSIRVDAAVPLDRVSPAAVLPPQAVLGNLPTVDLDESARLAVRHGRAVRNSGEAGRWGSGEEVALIASGELVAVARADGDWLRPAVVLEGQ